jgi:4-amino-4-deoxy-L-arabinose transferase-like glycosyltransferase
MRGGQNPFLTKKYIFGLLFVLGFGLRFAYGAARYRTRLIRLSGDSFIGFWDHDALEHILIGKALMSGKGYIVDDSPPEVGKHIRYPGQEALFKAPLYEFFLAGMFALSGFSFKLFFPVQALLGGLSTGLVGLIVLQVFDRPRAAWLAGVGAAADPLLVNAAPQPYGETLFIFFFLVSLWAFLKWFQTRHLKWALLSGAMTGLCMLVRENGLLLLVAMGAALLLAKPLTARTWVGYAVMAAVTIAVVAPWTLRNYARFGVFVPVASIAGVDFTEGNNECVATESLFEPYWAEGPCDQVARQRRELLAAQSFDPRVPEAVRLDRVCKLIAVQFVKDHPVAYAKLALRRFWTALLPYDPRGDQRPPERLALSLYWLLVFPAGIIGMILAVRRVDPARALLASLIVLDLASITAVLYWSDLRFRIGIDVLLACFAGWAYDEFLAPWTYELLIARTPLRTAGAGALASLFAVGALPRILSKK